MPTQYDGNPTATQAPASAPGNTVAVKTNLPVDGDTPNVSSIYQPFKVLADWIAWLRDNRARTTFVSAVGDAVITGGLSEGSVQVATATTITQGSTVVKQVVLSVTIELTAGANDIVLTLTSSLAMATSIDAVVASLSDWSGGTPTAPLVHAKTTNANEIAIYAQGFGTAVTCRVDLFVQGT